MRALEVLYQHLPPPQYMRMPSVGVDISDTSLKYVKFRADGRTGKLAVAAHGDLAIPEGTLARGEVQDAANLTAALAEVKRRTKTEYVRVSLPEERAYLFETRIKKNVSFGEVRSLLEFRLEENVPLSPRDAYFDYDIYPLAGVSDELGVSVTAYACGTINGYYEACRSAKVVPLSFEVEAQAIMRAVLPPGARGTFLIVDFGKMRTGVGIVHNGVLMYTSTIDIGGKELSSALRAALGEQQEESALTEIKNTDGLTPGTKSHDALMAPVTALTDEISKRIEYWNGRDVGNEDRFIERVLLCGGSANLKGLPEHLASAVDIETARAEVWLNALAPGSVPPIDRQHAYGYATAVGLALKSWL